MRFKTTQNILHVLKYLIVLSLLNKILTQSSVKLPVILFVLMMRQCQFQVMIHVYTLYIDTLVQSIMLYTIQCNITSEGASVAKCDKNITTEIDSKLISHRSFDCRMPPFIQKVIKHNYLRSRNFKGAIMCPDPCQTIYWLC